MSWKDYKAVTADLKKIYQATTETQARSELKAFARTWDGKYPQISKSWQRHWASLITLYGYPPEIRKIIYTTNAIESLNSVIRKAIKKRKIFPNDKSELKVISLATEAAAARWTMPVRDWKATFNHFTIEFEGRL